MPKAKKSESEKVVKIKPAKAVKPPKLEKAAKPAPAKKAKKKDKVEPVAPVAAVEIEPVAAIIKTVKKIIPPKLPKAIATEIVLSIEEISLRAYFIAERRQAMGWEGDSSQDWVEAERQLKAEAKKKKK